DGDLGGADRIRGTMVRSQLCEGGVRRARTRIVFLARTHTLGAGRAGAGTRRIAGAVARPGTWFCDRGPRDARTVSAGRGHRRRSRTRRICACSPQVAVMIRPPAGVLFVCLGNICRSPTAEYVARTEFEKLGLRIPVASRGLGNWHVGQGADPRAVAAARAQGYALSPHRARQFHEDDFARFGTVLAVDRATLAELRRRVPEDMPPPQRFLVAAGLASRRSGDDGDVPDPYTGTPD